MLDTSKFYESFDKAGFLTTALWTPSAGLPGAGIQQSAQVRFKAPNRDALAGEFSVTDHTIKYPSTVLTGLKRGETLTVGGIAFKVREGPQSELDGTVLQAFLAKV
jgi:hypothetical protein